MHLSRKLRAIITENAIQDDLEELRKQVGSTTTASQTCVRDILFALSESSSGFVLLTTRETMDSLQRMYLLRLEVQRGVFAQLDLFQPLLDCIISGSSDVEIWEAALEVVTVVYQQRPSTSVMKSTSLATPVRTNSSQVLDSESHDIVQDELFKEFRVRIFDETEGFFDVFLSKERWTPQQFQMYESMLSTYIDNRWTGFPEKAEEKEVRKWLYLLQQNHLSAAEHCFDHNEHATEFNGRKAQLDFFVLPKSVRRRYQELSTGKDRMDLSNPLAFKHVLVVGELKESYSKSDFRSNFFQLARYMRTVLFEQPLRLFAHGFLLCGNIMQPYIFDRAGAVGAGAFDINKAPNKFALAMVNYATMDNDAMGYSDDVEPADDHQLVTLDQTHGLREQVTYKLMGEPLTRQNAIVCRGTTCYETEDGLVAKFSWASSERTPELFFLLEAERLGVHGVARVVASREFTSTAMIRQGMVFGRPHKFRGEDKEDHLAMAMASNVTGTDSNKRKSLSGSPRAPKSKRKSGERKTEMAKDSDEDLSGSKPTSRSSKTDQLWDNKTLTCIVVAPKGRLIRHFRSLEELLFALRDAIKAHQALYRIGTLHRDISPSNVIITDRAKTGCHGMLIDLDLAKKVGDANSGARHLTGTKQFMALGVLRREDHTYRHDLESFLYVFLWLCASQSWQNGLGDRSGPPSMNEVDSWTHGSLLTVANSKESHMLESGFDRVLSRFPSSLADAKVLCWDLRRILFGQTPRLDLSSPEDEDELYGPILKALDDAVDML